VLSFPSSVKVYLAPGTTDMRKGMDSLAAAARVVLDKDPYHGHVFVFCGRRRHVVKVLYGDNTGLWLIAKRLAKGTFAWPDAPPEGSGCIELSTAELAALLGGLDLRRSTWREWGRPADRLAV
jgi:transposase